MEKKQFNPKLFVDLDGTVAEWRSAAKYEDLFCRGYFLSLNPHAEVVEAVKRLHASGIEVFVLSAYLTESRYALEEKDLWVSRHIPFVDVAHRFFVPQEIAKCDYVAGALGHKIKDDCFLLDDYSKNLHEWKASGGVGIKLLNGINGSQKTWTGEKVNRFDTPAKLFAAIQEIVCG